MRRTLSMIGLKSNNPITNDWTIKADLYLGSQKDTKVNIPIVTSDGIQFVSQSVMYVEDYG